MVRESPWKVDAETKGGGDRLDSQPPALLIQHGYDATGMT